MEKQTQYPTELEPLRLTRFCIDASGYVMPINEESLEDVARRVNEDSRELYSRQ